MTEIEKKTPLYDAHVELGAKIVNFHDFLMPIQYDSIISEHKNVRVNAGLFDISHMGKIIIEGEGATELIQWIVTNDITPLPDFGILYTPICNSTGGIIDDVLIYKYNYEKYMLVVNCANVKKVYDWIKKFDIGDANINNLSNQISLLALQGPKSEGIIHKTFGDKCAALQRFRFIQITKDEMELTISRTGYTGEDGFEIFANWPQCEGLWNILLENGKEIGLKPSGLGARDTLRLEAGFLLYGNDINETTTPLEANIGWTVKFEKKDFVGKDPLSKQRKNGMERKLIAFKMLDKSIPRANNEISDNDNVIGKVTSGTFSPTLGVGMGLGYVDINFAQINNQIHINIRGSSRPAVIVNTPFVQKSEKGT